MHHFFHLTELLFVRGIITKLYPGPTVLFNVVLQVAVTDTKQLCKITERRKAWSVRVASQNNISIILFLQIVMIRLSIASKQSIIYVMPLSHCPPSGSRV